MFCRTINGRRVVVCPSPWITTRHFGEETRDSISPVNTLYSLWLSPWHWQQRYLTWNNIRCVDSVHDCIDLLLEEVCNVAMAHTAPTSSVMGEERSNKQYEKKTDERWAMSLSELYSCSLSIFSIVFFHGSLIWKSHTIIWWHEARKTGGHYDNCGGLLNSYSINIYEEINRICAAKKAYLVILTNLTAPNRNASLSVWETWQKIVLGSGEERNLTRCQSTTCIVMLWHFKHLECTLCFDAFSFFCPEEITNQQSRHLWPEGLWGGFVTARLPVWLPRPSGIMWDGGGEWVTLSPPLNNCCWRAHL